MASCLLSVALLFTPPVAPGPHGAGSVVTSSTAAMTSPRPMFFKELLSWPPTASASTAALLPPTPSTGSPTIYDLTSDPVSYAPTEKSVVTVSLLPLEEPAPTAPATPRERALNRLAELGAAQWQIGVFDCIGRHESGWVNKRSDNQNSDGTFDLGVFQLNQIHGPQLRAQGLDPWVPEDAATFAWQLSRQGTTFRPWVVSPLCVRT